MARRTTIEIPADSRYKDTGVIYNVDLDEVFFEMWERPKELDAMVENAERYLVRSVDIGRLDLIAYDYYGNVALWWVIAAVNNLTNPIRDMFPGQKLYVPDYDSVIRMVSRSGVVVEETQG